MYIFICITMKNNKLKNCNRSGARDYNEEDCKWVEFVICMRGAGLQTVDKKEKELRKDDFNNMQLGN